MTAAALRAHVETPFDDAKFRAEHVGASEVAALFGCCPYATEFELWHRKAGNIDATDLSDNERVQWGVRLEPVIIAAACDKWGYTPLETPTALSNGEGLGGHPDKIVMCPVRGRGILETKTADWLVAKKWGDEPPAHYLLQANTYAGLAECDWADIIVLVGGNELRRYQYDFRPVIHADVEAKVRNFWQSIRDGKPPKPDYTRDGDALLELAGESDGTLIDLRHDNYASDLADQYLEAKRRVAEAETDVDRIKAELIEKIGSATFAMLPAHRISAAMTKGSVGTLITQEHIGTTIGARKGWRRFDVRESL
jgi:predicted phage-related endonuclease